MGFRAKDASGKAAAAGHTPCMTEPIAKHDAVFTGKTERVLREDRIIMQEGGNHNGTQKGKRRSCS